MGLHALAMVFDKRPTYVPSETELGLLGGLERRCLESVDSGVRMDAVLLCVAMHGRLGEGKFWEVLSGVGEDPKNVITYYIVKRQREEQAVAT
jgi:CLIP-associating protein 1/2